MKKDWVILLYLHFTVVVLLSSFIFIFDFFFIYKINDLLINLILWLYGIKGIQLYIVLPGVRFSEPPYRPPLIWFWFNDCYKPITLLVSIMRDCFPKNLTILLLYHFRQTLYLLIKRKIESIPLDIVTKRVSEKSPAILFLATPVKLLLIHNPDARGYLE